MIPRGVAFFGVAAAGAATEIHGSDAIGRFKQEMSETFVRFGPNAILFVLAIAVLDEGFQSFFRSRKSSFAFVFVSIFGGAPERVGATKFDPAFFVGRQFGEVDRFVKRVGLFVGFFGVETFGLGIDFFEISREADQR